MKYLYVSEILDIIDKQFGYDFEGKDNDDHLISNKTWIKYVGEFLENIEDEFYETYKKDDEWEKIKEFMEDYKASRIQGKNRFKKYREDLVIEIINFRKSQLINQFNSNRKTTLDYQAIEIFEYIASVLGMEVDKDIYNNRIPITQYKRKREKKPPTMSKEDIENTKNHLIQEVVNQLIDMEKLNHDVYQYLISGSLEYGFAIPPEMKEDIDGSPLGFRIDTKNYLKESVIKELVKI